MDAKNFAIRLVERLRNRAEELLKSTERRPVVPEDKAVARALTETADCIEETLATYDE